MVTASFAGLASGAIYALIAIGYNITLTSAGVLNFAFANTLVLGGYVAVSALALGLPVIVVLPICAIVCAVVSILVERAAIRFLPAGSHAELITTLGAGTVITAMIVIIWGPDPLRIPLFEQGAIDLFGGRVTPISLILIVLPIIFGAALHLLMKGTRFGRTSRAQAFDREATMLRGVDVRWLSIAAFAIAGVFAGVVGPFVLMSTSASPWLTIGIALKGFVALALGGIGSQLGAVLAGFIIGLVEAYVALFAGPFFGDYAVFILFLLVLVLRPMGIFGNRTLRTV